MTKVSGRMSEPLSKVYPHAGLCPQQNFQVDLARGERHMLHLERAISERLHLRLARTGHVSVTCSKA